MSGEYEMPHVAPWEHAASRPTPTELTDLSLHRPAHSPTPRATGPGAETLEIMAAAPRYNIWQYRRIAPFLGRRVCEVGAGIGNMSALLTHSRPELLVLTDTDPYYRNVLQQTVSRTPGLRVEDADAARCRRGGPVRCAADSTRSSPST